MKVTGFEIITAIHDNREYENEEIKANEKIKPLKTQIRLQVN